MRQKTKNTPKKTRGRSGEKITGEVAYKEFKVAKHSSVEEQLVAYGRQKVNRITMDVDRDNVADCDISSYHTAILGDATNKPENLMTPLEKMTIVKVGISKNDLESLKKKTELDYDNLARALSVTRATLINKKGKEKFNSVLSERIVSLADIYSYGYEVFENEDHFNQWMFRPNRALGGKFPYELLDNQFGREEVRDIIGRIDYGVYS